MKNSKMRVTLDDYVRANRRASRNPDFDNASPSLIFVLI